MAKLRKRTKIMGLVTMALAGATTVNIINDLNAEVNTKNTTINELNGIVNDLLSMLSNNFTYEASLEEFIKNNLGESAVLQAAGLIN